MKLLSKILLAIYLLVLLWLVLFKFSLDIPAVLGHQMRSLNLVPFTGFSQGNSREMIDNFVVFVPLGLLLSVNFKRMSFWRKLAFVFFFSITAEVIQFVLAIGTTDITDVIMNTLGGLFGLMLYGLSDRLVDNQKLERCIVITGTILLIVLILLRFLVLKVRY